MANLKTDYKDLIWNGRKKYNVINNADGTISLEDVTEYTNEVESAYNATDVNATNIEVNRLTTEMNTVGSTIVDSGENDNGEWWKWDNGLMICTYNKSRNASIGQASGNLYNGLENWNFPQQFIAAPVVSVGQAKWETGASWGTVAGVSTTIASIRLIDNYQRGRGTLYLGLMAIGRWK